MFPNWCGFAESDNKAGPSPNPLGLSSRLRCGQPSNLFVATIPMPEASLLLAFLAALAILELTPGPDMMAVIARGVGQGGRIAWLTVVGIVFVAGPLQVLLLVLGLASLITAYPMALNILQWAGALYLFYFGSKLLLRSVGANSAEDVPVASVSGWTVIREGALNSLTNPKSLLFKFTFLPLFVDPSGGSVWRQLLVLGAMQKLIGVFSLGALRLSPER